MKTKHILVFMLVTMGLILGGPLFARDWRDIPLRDVVGGTSDFPGKFCRLVPYMH